MLVDSEEVDAGALLDELSVADGVALESLEEPVVLGEELDPLVEDDESLGLVVELVPEPFVASSFRQSSFAVPLSESQRGELPYELVEEPLVDESFDDDGPYVELCANAAIGKASATAITAVLSFIESPLRGRG